VANSKDTVYPLIKEGKLPRHIAIIMDGNGRWASERGLPRMEGHRAGANAVDKVVTCCRKTGIPTLSLFAFSTENWKRPDNEVKALFDLLNIYLKKKLNTMIKNEICLRISGDTSRIPEKSRKLIDSAIQKTSSFTGMTLNICINYGSRDELLCAIEKIIKNRISSGDIKKISSKPEWREIEENLYTSGLPDVDLLIRTAGEQRLSNFLLLQAAYAELYFTATGWPDFSDQDIYLAIMEFQKRIRKFGGLNEKNKTMEKIHE